MRAKSVPVLIGLFVLAGPAHMIGALERLFMSHPPIPERIAALRSARYPDTEGTANAR